MAGARWHPDVSRTTPQYKARPSVPPQGKRQARGIRLNREHHTVVSTRQVLLPPKPKELDSAVRTVCGRAWLATWHRRHSGSGFSRLIVGGTARRSMAARQATASAAAAAVSRWPVMLLVELTGTRASA